MSVFDEEPSGYILRGVYGRADQMWHQSGNIETQDDLDTYVSSKGGAPIFEVIPNSLPPQEQCGEEKKSTTSTKKNREQIHQLVSGGDIPSVAQLKAKSAAAGVPISDAQGVTWRQHLREGKEGVDDVCLR